jgi:oligosaccharide reducing-end xylanase
MRPLSLIPGSICLGAFLTLGVSSALAAVAPPYTVATWHGFREAAISYTFDDNTPNQFAVAVPMFNEKGFRMTLYPVVNWNGGQWQRLIDAAEAGHEIGSHTISHPSLGPLSAERQITEMGDSKSTLEANIPGLDCVTLAYPNCSVADQGLTEQYYIAARICSQQIVPATPSNFYQISSLICGVNGTVNSVADFERYHTNALNRGGWAVYLIHAIDDDSGYSKLKSETLEASLDYLAARRETYWVDTFGNVVRYIREREAVRVSERISDDDRIFVTVTDDLDDAIYNHPVTFRRPLPAGWESAYVTQAGTTVEATVIEIEGVSYLQFDAVPDAGETLLSNKAEGARSPTLSLGRKNAAGGALALRLEGNLGESYTLEESTNLSDWGDVEGEPVEGPVGEVLVEGSDAPRFFRAKSAEAAGAQ